MVSFYVGFLITYNTVTAIVGLLGNGVVLLASFKSSVFRLDKLTILLIQNLAISDFLYLLLVIVPSFNSYIKERWLLGDTLCYMVGFVGTWLASANLHFILFVAAHRFLKCVRPWRMRRVRRSRFSAISLLIWVFSSLKIVVLSVMGAEITYNNDIYRCGVNYVGFGKQHPTILTLVWVIAKWVPFALVMVLNASLIFIAKKKFKKTTARGIMTISSISILLILSWIPAQIYSIMGAVQYSSITTVKIFEKIAYIFYLLSVSGNPIIYGFQNKHFAAFVRTKCKHLSKSATT